MKVTIKNRDYMRIILCVTGSVAATESIKLARSFKRLGFDVKSFVSEAGTKIIHPNSLKFATGEEVVLELSGEIEHVKHAKADLILVAPATANTISKFAYKIADNHITSLLIAAQGHDTPILFVPSMHDSMYIAISENIDKIKSEGFNFVKPKINEGKAKFPNIEDIILESIRTINLSTDKADFLGKKVLITLGGTYEAIDPIRGITNMSSGKMGLELAKQAYIRGADLTVIAGNIDVTIPNLINVISVKSSKQMNEITKKLVKENDAFIATAAVSDFAPIEEKSSKLSSSYEISLDFKPTEKIIKQMKDISPNTFLVGFKAEYNISDDKIIASAKKQIKEVGTDLVVANDLSTKGCGFGSNDNEVILVDDSVAKIPITSKKEISKIIFDKIADLL
jgi:phosphopantothenoylcysteine decarboxylase/phosphopantothenate--cysteine ligase